MDVNNIRREYLKGGLRRNTLLADPFEQFDLWLEQAIAAELPDPTAMILASVDGHGRPRQRIVLLKGSDPEGFVFFTNYQSAKGCELAANPLASLLFPWHMLERQVRIEGRVERVSREESQAYFSLRPRESQVAAWASPQSEPLGSRQQLLTRFKDFQQAYSEQAIPLPEHWGGYRLRPDYFEFWQGGASRLHDRFAYTTADSGWLIQRLAP